MFKEWEIETANGVYIWYATAQGIAERQFLKEHKGETIVSVRLVGPAPQTVNPR